jgi:hypothetical protein
MTLEEFRVEMDASWRAAREEATASKDPFIAIEQLHALYRKFSADERHKADQVIAEWALESDEIRRWDALALIDDLKLVAAIPALRALARRLAQAAKPDEAFWVGRASQLADSLEKSSRSSP